LPVPLAPVSSTVVSVGATFLAWPSAVVNAGERPWIVSKPKRSSSAPRSDCTRFSAP